MSFPKDFVWGVATAAYQIEGAAGEDGRGLSVWDVFCKRPGAIHSGHTGDVACDHYHRFKEDIALMKQIGVKAYRLSVSWPRVMPSGAGAVNEKGLAFYDRLIDELLAAGIQPWVTLFHWDYPFDLYCRGGWLSPDSPRWFADYTTVLARRLGDRVKHWMTLNEPIGFLAVGHLDDRHAPGVKYPYRLMLQCAHNTFLAHGRAVQVLRAECKIKPRIGLASVACATQPASDSPADVDAARTAAWSMTKESYWNNTWWNDPLYLGRYPEEGLKSFGDSAPKIAPGDMEMMCQRLDFCAFNIYKADTWRAGKNGPELVPLPVGVPMSGLKAPITPEGIYWHAKFCHERYKLPIAVTENGMTNVDFVHLDGKVHDPQRIDFLARTLSQLGRAHDDGVPIEAYMHWSLMDNFEWSFGYTERFGLVHVDYLTQKRTLKDSAYWYRDTIAANGADLK